MGFHYQSEIEAGVGGTNGVRPYDGSISNGQHHRSNDEVIPRRKGKRKKKKEMAEENKEADAGNQMGKRV